jgi:Mg/Co/Ni transporter MgtE
MDEQKIDLALAFLQSQPGAAAAILEQQPLPEVAEFLGKLPHTYGALVLTKMLPQYSARLCQIMQPVEAAGMLSKMEISLVAAIMRQCHHDLSEQLLGMLPDKSRLATRLLLNYSEDTVGAWMHANIAILPDSCNAEEALRRITADQQSLDIGHSLVVNRERKLKGSITLAALLRAPANATITAVMTRSKKSISAQTPLKSVIDNPLWDTRDSIAVTNRNQQLLGVLRHLDLRKGLDEIETNIVQPQGSDSITGMLEVYGNSLLILFSTLSEIARGNSRHRH